MKDSGVHKNVNKIVIKKNILGNICRKQKFVFSLQNYTIHITIELTENIDLKLKNR